MLYTGYCCGTSVGNGKNLPEKLLKVIILILLSVSCCVCHFIKFLLPQLSLSELTSVI